MKTKNRYAALLLVIAVLAGVAAAPSANSVSAREGVSQQFYRRSQLMLDNQGALTTDKTTLQARLNRNKLEKKNVSAEDMAFLQELTNFSNDVVETSKTNDGIGGATTKLGKYPEVKEYFKQATALAESGQILSLRKRGQPHPLTTFAIIGNPITEAAGMADCGIYWSPKPTVGKSWVTYNVSNVDNTLRSWGYHSTLGLAGGGWTRSQTWHPWNCGWNTFRDHALKISGTTLREQNYHGWNPRGEPNPEVYISGPWPYSTWPAYVYWWHSTH